MPFRSKAQSRLMHAAAADPAVAASTGVDQGVAQKFVREGEGKKQGGLPQHVKRKDRDDRSSPYKLPRRRK